MNDTPNRTHAIYAILLWMVVNAIFFFLELTIIGDSADLNNSIEFVLFTASVVGLISMRKAGAALTTFTLIYTLAFNVFNVIYYEIYLLNGTSAVINAIATIYMFTSIFAQKFR